MAHAPPVLHLSRWSLPPEVHAEASPHIPNGSRVSLCFCACSFSHPVGVLPLAALSVNDGAGAIEKVVSQGPGGSMCSQFLIYAKASGLPSHTLAGMHATAVVGHQGAKPQGMSHACSKEYKRELLGRVQVPFSPWDTLASTLCVSLVGAAAPDVTGIGFPDAKNCSTLDHRRGRLAPMLPLATSACPSAVHPPGGQFCMRAAPDRAGRDIAGAAACMPPKG